MFRCLLLLTIAAAAHASHPIRQEIVDQVQNSSWEAYAVDENPLAHLSSQEIVNMMGLVDYRPIATSAVDEIVGDIPSSFDARDKWSQCVHPIRNQAKCGSCWAFAAAETLTANLCVLGLDPPVLSPQDLVSCDSSDHGCHGGTLPGVWDYIDSTGMVSDSCMPYVSGDGQTNETCPLPGCADGSNGEATVYKCPKTHSMLDSDAAIQAAVMTVGAVEVGFTVYEDFMNYKSGIYKYSSGLALGGHAVKIVGWGQDLLLGNETFYWIVQNSWGAAWGESGYFKIVNWHEDMDSAIGIGGGFACVQGNQPAPPAPPTPPAKCDDIVSYCNKYDHEQCKAKPYLIPVCKKTCGCCDSAIKPSYCPK